VAPTLDYKPKERCGWKTKKERGYFFRTRRTWKDNIEMDQIKLCAECIHLAWDRVQWWVQNQPELS
jgi:hypothetical protein